MCSGENPFWVWNVCHQNPPAPVSNLDIDSIYLQPDGCLPRPTSRSRTFAPNYPGGTIVRHRLVEARYAHSSSFFSLFSQMTLFVKSKPGIEKQLYLLLSWQYSKCNQKKWVRRHTWLIPQTSLSAKEELRLLNSVTFSFKIKLK